MKGLPLIYKGIPTCFFLEEQGPSLPCTVYLSVLKSTCGLPKNYQGSWFLSLMNPSAYNSACPELVSNKCRS